LDANTTDANTTDASTTDASTSNASTSSESVKVVIGRIRGQLLAVEENIVIIDVNGVGYEVEVAESMLLRTTAGQPIELYTHLSVREDAHLLFGFTTVAERDLFRTLIKVSGVGPRLALALLSGMPVAEFARCVRDNDIGRLVKLPGVGKKTAERPSLNSRIEWHGGPWTAWLRVRRLRRVVVNWRRRRARCWRWAIVPRKPIARYGATSSRVLRPESWSALHCAGCRFRRRDDAVGRT
jgi:hypothetical protein